MTLVAAFFHFSALFALLVSFIALALTRLSIFHSWLVLALAFAGVLVLWIKTDILKTLTSASTPEGTRLGAGFPILLATMTFVFSFFFPIFQLSGACDEGNYFIQSVQIARTGALNLDLEVLRDPEVQSLGQTVKGDFPGIYSARNRGYSSDPAELIPQFNHLSSATRAVLTGVVGIRGVLATTSLFAVLASLSFFYLAQRVIGFPLASIASVALIFNAAFLWNSRTSLSETFTLFFLAYGALIGAIALQRNLRLLGALAGFSLGLAVFSRVDGTLVAFLMSVFVASSLLEDTSRQRAGVLRISLTVFTLMFGAALLDLYTSSRPYFEDLLSYGVDLLLAGTSAAVALAWAALAARPLLTSARIVVLKQMVRYSLGVATCALLLSFVYFLYFGALRADPSIHNRIELFTFRATSELEWYVTLPVFALYFVGLLISCRRFQAQLYPLLIFSGIALLTFMYSSSINPIHPYASRRWLPYVIPFVILIALLPIGRLLKRKLTRSAAVLIVVIGAIYVSAQGRIAWAWVLEPQLVEWRDGYRQLSSELDALDQQYLFSDSPRVASILTYIYGVDVLLLSPDWRDRLPAGLVLVPVKNLPQICGTRLAQTTGRRPTELYRSCLDPNFYVLERQVYRLGDRIDFSAAGKGMVFRREGWSGAEPWGTWSVGTEARLSVDLDSPENGDLVLEADVKGFVVAQHPKQTVGVQVNGQPVAEWQFDRTFNRGIRRAVISKEIAAQRPLEIAFRIPEAVSPAELGISSDERRIGLGLISLAINPVSSSQ